MEPIGLTWVVVAGQPAHVSSFAALPPRRRPAATCPVCGRQLTLKLGRIRRHHAAHAATVLCAATRPETALHSDVKLHLASQLAAAVGSATPLPLVVRARCAGARGQSCDATYEREWIRGWDEVLVETRVAYGHGSHRPDILLRRRGAPVAAIEVLASHAVGEDKAIALAAAGVPWIETRADAGLLEGKHAWRLGRPLPVVREAGGDSREGMPWRCTQHAASHRAWLESESRRRAAEEEAARRSSVLRAARVVDVYEQGGGRDRVIYRIDELVVDGRVRALVLRGGGREIASAPMDDTAASRRAASASLQAAYRSDVERLTARPGSFADSAMRWATGDAAENLVSEATSDFAGRDPSPLATRYPRRWYYARERRTWFLPREMRDVRWDRPAGDVFAPHPAWLVSRSAVRERPAPEDAWTTFAFASRPSVTAFGPGSRVEHDGALAILHLGEPVARALVVVTAAVEDVEVFRVARSLETAGVEQLWLSHPRDWSASRREVPWAPAGRDSRGQGVVIVDGVGIYRAESFARAFARGDRRVRTAAVSARSAERVARLVRSG